MAKPLPLQNRFDLYVLGKLVQKEFEHESG